MGECIGAEANAPQPDQALLLYLGRLRTALISTAMETQLLHDRCESSCFAHQHLITLVAQLAL